MRLKLRHNKEKFRYELYIGDFVYAWLTDKAAEKDLFYWASFQRKLWDSNNSN